MYQETTTQEGPKRKIYTDLELKALMEKLEQYRDLQTGRINKQKWLIAEKALTPEGAVIINVLEMQGNHIKRCTVAHIEELENMWGQLMSYLGRSQYASTKALDHYASMPEAQGELVNKMSMSERPKVLLRFESDLEMQQHCVKHRGNIPPFIAVSPEGKEKEFNDYTPAYEFMQKKEK
jgi:hypothetical protein